VHALHERVHGGDGHAPVRPDHRGIVAGADQDAIARGADPVAYAGEEVELVHQ
jgi:hypothetical protein